MGKKRINLTILLLLLLIALIFFFLPFQKAFTFTEYRTDHPAVFYLKQSGETEFQIRYVHSIFLSNVLETYQVVQRDKIKMLSMKYEDVGIGLPAYAEEGETLTIKDGVYTLSYDNRVIESFVLYVGDVDADLAFKYKQHEYDLKQHLTRGKSYLFRMERITLFQMMKGVNLSG
ncbi:hypothetical protein NCCP2222_07300 [Sporosarcina sp. NCCP-2222]|uniref:DUF1850 domain-containing protein n=1 Tax=Sporosarcina sp. NCCP-2222 TaxID=2935073 RepID=UPI0020827702|nr:DUF1850 domain-containing protein [Sporosarcina sp. NCCP-2222]GKV54783.1 hypothetical protein NCCP2222_07300 [Sporosarcina sp. NCCP-2222]